MTAATVKQLEHRPVTTSIGTVFALRSITLSNEVAGTVRHAALTPGRNRRGRFRPRHPRRLRGGGGAQSAGGAGCPGEDDAVTRQNLRQDLATAQEEVDRARADLQVALAQIARTKAIIARKTIRAPFRARVGLADVHPGQYLNEGTFLTTLQGMDNAVHVDLPLRSRWPQSCGWVRRSTY